MSDSVEQKTAEAASQQTHVEGVNAAKFSKVELVGYIADMALQLSQMAQENNLPALQARLMDVYTEASNDTQISPP